MEQKPSVGRVVHYQAYGTPGGEFKSLPRAAIIAGVGENDACDIVVFNPLGLSGGGDSLALLELAAEGLTQPGALARAAF